MMANECLGDHAADPEALSETMFAFFACEGTPAKIGADHAERLGDDA